MIEVNMWQAGRMELPFTPFQTKRKAIKAAKQILTEVGNRDRVDG